MDVNLFTDVIYESINFHHIKEALQFQFMSGVLSEQPGMGISCLIGNNDQEAIKLDLLYTDSYAYPALTVDGIRMVDAKELSAMKLEVMGHGGEREISGISMNYSIILP